MVAVLIVGVGWTTLSTAFKPLLPVEPTSTSWSFGSGGSAAAVATQLTRKTAAAVAARATRRRGVSEGRRVIMFCECPLRAPEGRKRFHSHLGSRPDRASPRWVKFLKAGSNRRSE